MIPDLPYYDPPGEGTVCWADVETTGLDPDRHEIWEVALIYRREGSACHRVWQLPVDLSRADPMALKIGGFHDRWKASNTTSPEQFARTFVGITRGLHLVGANVAFDADRLSRLIRRVGECPMWHYHLVDVEAMAAGWIARECSDNDSLLPVRRPDGTLNHMDGRPPWTSTDLSLALGVDPEAFDRHTALGDVRWAQAMYEAMTATRAGKP